MKCLLCNLDLKNINDAKHNYNYGLYTADLYCDKILANCDNHQYPHFIVNTPREEMIFYLDNVRIHHIEDQLYIDNVNYIVNYKLNAKDIVSKILKTPTKQFVLELIQKIQVFF